MADLLATEVPAMSLVQQDPPGEIVATMGGGGVKTTQPWVK